MKKEFAVVMLVLLLFLCFCSCGQQNAKETNQNDTYQNDQYQEATNNKILTEDDVRNLAAQALYEKICGFASAYNAKAENTQYRITSIEHFDGFYSVEGVYTLYDAYGKYVGHLKENEPFSVKVYESGSATVTKCGY